MTSPFSNVRFLMSFVTSLLILAAAHATVLIWYGLTWKIAGFDSFISNSLLAIACIAVSNGLRYYMPDKNRMQYIIVWCIGLSMVWLAVTNSLLVFFLNEEKYSGFVSQSLPFRFALSITIIGWMATLSVLWHKQEMQSENLKRKQDAESLERKAELLNLRQQLQPHFLFNSLNSINALISTRPDEAKKMVVQLSEFLRGTLRKDEKQLVKLQEEFKLLQLYLEIEKVRFGHRLQTEITCDEVAQEKLIPPMLLQPIVENAIKFGLYDNTGDVIIKLSCSFSENHLQIIIQNPYDPETAASNKGTGFGLISVQRRLYLLFGRNDLVITKAADKIYTSTITIPQA